MCQLILWFGLVARVGTNVLTRIAVLKVHHKSAALVACHLLALPGINLSCRDKCLACRAVRAVACLARANAPALLQICECGHLSFFLRSVRMTQRDSERCQRIWRVSFRFWAVLLLPSQESVWSPVGSQHDSSCEFLRGRPWRSPTFTTLQIMFRQRPSFRSCSEEARGCMSHQLSSCRVVLGSRVHGLTLVNRNKGFHHPGCMCDVRTKMDVGHACFLLWTLSRSGHCRGPALAGHASCCGAPAN
jgi:hypothetical protein